jgi:hypothetical protein
MRHIPQEILEDARDAVKCGRALAEIAGRLGLKESDLAMLIRSDLRKKQSLGNVAELEF